MPLDPSIILGVQQPQQNPMDTMVKAMQFKALASRGQTEQIQAQQAQQDYNDNQALRGAYSNNTSVDKSGKTNFDQQGFMTDIAKSAPSLIPKVQQQIAQQNYATLENKQKMNDLGIQLMQGANDQASWTDAKQQAASQGLPVDQIPNQYDPQLKASLLGRALNTKDYLANQVAQQEANNKAAAIAMEYHKTYGGNMPGFGQGSAAPSGQQVQGGSGQAITDPSPLVLQKVPTALQAKAFEEIKDNQNLAQIAKPSLDAFDQAANEVRPMTSGIHMSPTALVPGMESPGQKAFSGLANTTVKEVEGTARQAAFDSIQKNYRPQFGDSDSNIATKRAGWINYLKSHSASPVNSGSGIDLAKYSSTNIDPKIFGKKDSKEDLDLDSLPIGTTGTTKGGVPSVYKGKGVWVPQ